MTSPGASEQVIPAPGVILAATSCSSTGALAVATSAPQAAVQHLAPVPVAKQAAAAAQLGEFSQALALANMMDPQDVRPSSGCRF